MWPITAYFTKFSVGLSVCWMRPWALQKWLNQSRCGVWTWVDPRNNYVRWGVDHSGKWQFWGTYVVLRQWARRPRHAHGLYACCAEWMQFIYAGVKFCVILCLWCCCSYCCPKKVYLFTWQQLKLTKMSFFLDKFLSGAKYMCMLFLILLTSVQDGPKPTHSFSIHHANASVQD